MWWAGWAEAFIDDANRAADTLALVDANPLGRGKKQHEFDRRYLSEFLRNGLLGNLSRRSPSAVFAKHPSGLNVIRYAHELGRNVMVKMLFGIGRNIDRNTPNDSCFFHYFHLVSIR